MPGPGTWSPGDVLTAADLNAIGTWTTYTPVLNQDGTRTATVTYAAYSQINDLCIVTVDLECTQAGSAGNSITVSLPVTISTPGHNPDALSIGTGLFFDLSATDVIVLTAIRATNTTVGFVTDASTSTSGLGTTPSLALASGDVISFTLSYPC
jgi:hypothetical protein